MIKIVRARFTDAYLWIVLLTVWNKNVEGGIYAWIMCNDTELWGFILLVVNGNNGESPKKSLSNKPVSYTHLDVYKRQVYIKQFK